LNLNNLCSPYPDPALSLKVGLHFLESAVPAEYRVSCAAIDLAKNYVYGDQSDLSADNASTVYHQGELFARRACELAIKKHFQRSFSYRATARFCCAVSRLHDKRLASRYTFYSYVKSSIRAAAAARYYSSNNPEVMKEDSNENREIIHDYMVSILPEIIDHVIGSRSVLLDPGMIMGLIKDEEVMDKFLFNLDSLR